MIATASPRNRRAGGARAWIVARRGFRGFRFRAFRGFRGRPATATAQRLPFHDDNRAVSSMSRNAVCCANNCCVSCEGANTSLLHHEQLSQQPRLYLRQRSFPTGCIPSPLCSKPFELRATTGACKGLADARPSRSSVRATLPLPQADQFPQGLHPILANSDAAAAQQTSLSNYVQTYKRAAYLSQDYNSD